MDWAEPHVLQNATKQKKIKTNKQLDKGDGLAPAYAFLSARVLRPLTARTEAELTLRHPEHTETPRRRPEVILSRSAPLSAAPVNGSAFLTPPPVILYLLCLQALRVPPLQTPSATFSLSCRLFCLLAGAGCSSAHGEI